MCYELVCVSLRKQDLVSWHRIRNCASVERLLVVQGFIITNRKLYSFFSAFVLSTHNMGDTILFLVT